MASLLLLGGDSDLSERIARILPSTWRVREVRSWKETVRELLRPRAPDVLVFTSADLTEGALRSLVTLRRKGYAVPGAVVLLGVRIERAEPTDMESSRSTGSRTWNAISTNCLQGRRIPLCSDWSASVICRTAHGRNSSICLPPAPALGS